MSTSARAMAGSAVARRRSMAAARASTSDPWLRVPVSGSRRAASTSAAVWRVIRACAARNTKNSTPAATRAAEQRHEQDVGANGVEPGRGSGWRRATGRRPRARAPPATSGKASRRTVGLGERSARRGGRPAAIDERGGGLTRGERVGHVVIGRAGEPRDGRRRSRAPSRPDRRTSRAHDPARAAERARARPAASALARRRERDGVEVGRLEVLVGERADDPAVRLDDGVRAPTSRSGSRRAPPASSRSRRRSRGTCRRPARAAPGAADGRARRSRTWTVMGGIVGARMRARITARSYGRRGSMVLARASGMAAGVGFEPTGLAPYGVQDRSDRPLRHPASAIVPRRPRTVAAGVHRQSRRSGPRRDLFVTCAS